MKHLLIFFFLFSARPIVAQGVLTLQDKPFKVSVPTDSAVLHTISQSSAYAQMTKEEQSALYWINYMRVNPKRFWNNIMKEFLVQFPEAKSVSTRSLEADLKSAPSALPFLYADSALVYMAKAHAVDLKSRNGIISHTSGSGKTFVQRIQAAGRYKCGSENIYNGSFNGLESLIALLIDHGVPDKGHRKNLLNPRFELIGLSFVPFIGGKAILVQDLACR